MPTKRRHRRFKSPAVKRQKRNPGILAHTAVSYHYIYASCLIRVCVCMCERVIRFKCTKYYVRFANIF